MQHHLKTHLLFVKTLQEASSSLPIASVKKNNEWTTLTVKQTDYVSNPLNTERTQMLALPSAAWLIQEERDSSTL